MGSGVLPAPQLAIRKTAQRQNWSSKVSDRQDVATIKISTLVQDFCWVKSKNDGKSIWDSDQQKKINEISEPESASLSQSALIAMSIEEKWEAFETLN